MNRIIPAIVFIVFIISCNKTVPFYSDTNDNLPTTAETERSLDNTSFGVYKGVIIGSSGTIVFRINNSNNVVAGYLSFGNNLDTLFTTSPPLAGQSIINLQFTGKISSMKFSAEANGSNASLSDIRINGNDHMAAIIVHENSSLQVQCFEGTFTGGLTGIMNMIKLGPTDLSAPLYLLEKIGNDTVFYRGTGVLDTDTLTSTHYFYDYGNPYRTFSGKGKFNNNMFIGNWSSYSPAGIASGEFVCKRTY